ncbi:hypothetical protein PsAD2_03611 [Pseudovibrio axinellae]|uniref:Sulfate exporter family transporter n=1 Tax=Pseudovibrio axinellae TaxID=989403 RepID=A0A165VS16_9HYPH|nr:YeiH family protein [Pseudovibrio axinellae]KZL15355.1 hypothetical protein PsAD2_03611 [Pseudovibrio axinellae]SER53134.1 conserved hypothetical integral membrane protein [Pseudovibrio axinellae]
MQPQSSMPDQPEGPGALVPKWLNNGREIVPGLIIATVIAVAARYISEHQGGPVMLYALLIGMAVHSIYEDGSCQAGLSFAAKKVLRLGVILLGLRVSFSQILELGWQTLALVILSVLGMLLVGLVVARLLGRSSSFGLLTGGAVGICGASAALAISSVLPNSKENEQNTLFTVIAVTALSTLAMILYPSIGQMFGLDDVHLGIFFGATIHDVAQVIGAGFAVSDDAGEIATVVKLMRVMMLLPVIFIISFWSTRWLRNKDEPSASAMEVKAPVPYFAFGFAALVVVNSLGWIPETPHAILVDASSWCLVIAISALGVMTTLKTLVSLGHQHLFVIVGETLVLLGGIILALKYLV